MSNYDAILAMTSKVPENEEEDLGDRFVSENKENEIDGNAHTLIESSINPSIDKLIVPSNHQSIHQYIDRSIGQSIDS